MAPIEVGSILEGRVSGITKFGAFVDLGNKQTGLIHISEVADSYVNDVNDYLKENDMVRVKVIGADGNKIGLSIKQANPNYRTPRPRQYDRTPSPSFEDKLSKFLKDSDERHQDLKRHMDSKRGGRGTKFSGM